LAEIISTATSISNALEEGIEEHACPPIVLNQSFLVTFKCMETELALGTMQNHFKIEHFTIFQGYRVAAQKGL
jgi:hypothetical protein